VFQSFNLIPSQTALQNVALPLVFAGRPRREREAAARAMLEAVGLGARLRHRPAELSGGEQQRVALARALINRPPVLLADEPTGNLDSRTAEDVLRMLQKLNQEAGITVIIVTHDVSVARHTHRVIRMKDGVIIDEGAP